jgi:hypothetical protein
MLESLARDKRAGLLRTFVNYGCKKFITLGSDQRHQVRPGACIIKLITAVIYGARNKLECLSLNKLDWKRSPGTQKVL